MGSVDGHVDRGAVIGSEDAGDSCLQVDFTLWRVDLAAQSNVAGSAQ